VRRALVTSLLWVAALVSVATCGGRSELEVPPPLPPEPECDVDEDCPNFDSLCEPVRCVDPERYDGELPELPAGVPLPPRVCVVLEPVDCDDNDPCTVDECDEDTGLCTYGPATFDLDGDGFNAPRPGTSPEDPDSCGEDCNDASADAYPGNTEVCDGVDNDCNGIVDDGATFVPSTPATQISSAGVAPAGPGGLAFSGSGYMSIYTASMDGADMYQTALTPAGEKTEPIEQRFTFQNADSAGGPIVWVGDRYGVAWQDRRDGVYEAYFTLLKEDGQKATADTRLSFAGSQFSVNVDLTWNGTEFIVAWQDDRSGPFVIYGQRVSVDGVPIGSNIELSGTASLNDESPSLASGQQTVGMAFANGAAGTQRVLFRTYEQTTLEPRTEPIQLSDDQTEAVYPQAVWNEDRYMIVWYVRNSTNNAIFGATVDEDGVVLTPATPLTQPGFASSRYPSLLPLGDRALLVYSDDRDTGEYELYTRMIDAELAAITGEQRLTTAAFDSIYPITAFGADGDVGVLFRDDRVNGDDHVFFTRLSCVTQ
jgi:hypothetical protein